MIPSPVFLDLDEVLEIHRVQIEAYGGSDGIRDVRLLESALAAPQAGMAGRYFHADPFEMAAAYLSASVKNHPFVDGNKRVGLAAALVFLDRNGIEVEAPIDGTVSMVLEVAEGRRAKSGIAEFLRGHSRSSRGRRSST